jgi:phosphatidylglycerophosphate synthase
MARTVYDHLHPRTRLTHRATMLWTLPNILTWMRILAIPLVIVLFYLPYHWSDPAAGLLFAAAGITDSLDGYLRPQAEPDLAPRRVPRSGGRQADRGRGAGAAGRARRRRRQRSRYIIVLPPCVIIGREIAISALREWMAELGRAHASVAVSSLGKYKTILQMVGLAMMLYRWDMLGLPIYEHRPVPDGPGGGPDVVVDGRLPERRLAGAYRTGVNPRRIFRTGLLDLGGAETTICALLRRCGNSSVGRARPCQGRGREFESRFPLQIFPTEG